MKAGMLLAGVAFLGAATGSLSAGAEESSYTYGTVWQVDYMRTESGQFENYLDFLAREFKKQCDFGKKEGYVVSCRVLAVNATRANEPDVILMTEYKDYLTTAQRKDMQDKFEAMVRSDTRKLDKEFGDRKSMRTPMGSVEAQELNLK